MKRVLIFLYGLSCYVVFLATFLYAIGFIGNFATPTSLDATSAVSFGTALLTNLGLLAIFALQHSVMARPEFKRWWTKFVPQAAERSTYVLFSSLALIAMFIFWEPMGGTVWQVESTAAQVAIYGTFALGWLLVLYATFLIDHFDLFGMRQVTLYLLGRPYTPVPFRTPSLYRYVRHPLYVGWLMVFWSAPTMTIAHLVFAIATTAYIFIAIQFEERDLVRALPEYASYRERVPMMLPFRKRRSEGRTPLASTR